MDAAAIRASFVKISLKRACQDGAGALAARTFREFQRYLQWHPEAIPEPERSVNWSGAYLYMSNHRSFDYKV